LNHTADLAIRVEAESLEDLFITYARAMFDTMVGGRLEERITQTLELEANDEGELLLDWLKELLFLFERDGFIPIKYELNIMDNRLKARIVGDQFDPHRHTAHLEIKVPTYHRFSIKEDSGRWEGRIIFDV